MPTKRLKVPNLVIFLRRVADVDVEDVVGVVDAEDRVCRVPVHRDRLAERRPRKRRKDDESRQQESAAKRASGHGPA